MKYLLIALVVLAVSLTDGRNIRKTQLKGLRIPLTSKNSPAAVNSDPRYEQVHQKKRSHKIEELDQNEKSPKSQKDNSLEKSQTSCAIRAIQNCFAGHDALNTREASSENSIEGSSNNGNIRNKFAHDYYFDDYIEESNKKTQSIETNEEKNNKKRFHGIYIDDLEEDYASLVSIARSNKNNREKLSDTKEDDSSSQELIDVGDIAQCVLESIVDYVACSISQAEDSQSEENLKRFGKQQSDEYNPSNEIPPYTEASFDWETIQEFWDWMVEHTKADQSIFKS